MKKFLILLAFPLLAHAWEPTKPVQVLIGTAPGSGNEISFRESATILSQTDKKTKWVEGMVSISSMIRLMCSSPKL